MRTAATTARIGSSPEDGATAIPVGVWPELRVEPASAATSIEQIGMVCDEAAIGVRIHRLATGRIVVQPERRLPAEQACRVAWTRAGSPESIGFETFRASAAPGRALTVVYRRADSGEVAPVPDDFWTVRDPTTATGLRLDLPVAVRGDVREVIEGLRAELARADGWSPIGPIVLPISDRIDPESIPRTVEASLDPTSTIALVDIDPGSPGRGERFPFEAVLRKDRTAIGLEDHALWVLPARPLRAGGRYALLMRRGIASSAGRAMVEPVSIRSILARSGGSPSGANPSSAESASGGAATSVAAPAWSRVKGVVAAQLEPVLTVADAALAIPWTRDDLVFALPFTVRSLVGFERDPLALLEGVRALTGPRLEIERVEVVRDPARPLAAVVHGRFAVPVWRERRTRGIARNADGSPRVVGRDALRFVLALPRRAVKTPAPILMYQHGNPGSASEEIGSIRQDAYLEAGFAVVGFTDLWNRGKPQGSLDRRQLVVRQVAALADSVRKKKVVPDDWLVTLGEQLALVEALPELASLDVLPVSAPDGRPEIDGRLPLVYEGISQGAIHGQALVAYSDRVRAASLVAGGARLAELALHQAASSMVKALPFLFGDFRPLDLWVTLALFQTAIDRQDAHLHALRLHRGVVPGDPASTPRRDGSSSLDGERAWPSLLLTAGTGDSYIPLRASRSLAWVLGPLAWLEAKDASGLSLPRAEAPLRGNLADGTTGAYVEIVPYGSSLPTAPGCHPEVLPLPEEILREGHFCAQLAEESIRRRVAFLRAAVDAAPPTVIDPFARADSAR